MTLNDIGLYTLGPKWQGPEKPLHAQVRCVCALIRRYLPRWKNDHAHKINVYVGKVSVTEQTVQINNGLASISLMRDVAGFYDLGSEDKRRFAFDALLEGAMLIFSEIDWPVDKIREAFDFALQDSLINEWKFQPKLNPSRKLRAYIKCLHGLDSFDAWMCIEDREGNVIEQRHLFSEMPDELCFYPLLGKVRWMEKEVVGLESRAGQLVGDVVKVTYTE